MKFGKLPDVSNVDFTLPPDAAVNAQTLQQYAANQEDWRVYIGATGWSMKEWVGTVYPAGAKQKDYLRHYAKQFNTIELNTTHYRIPTFSTIEKWYKESTPDFKFCPKIPQTISHRRDLGLNGEQITLFCDAIAGLQEKLGCCFMQLSPYFGADKLAILDQFLQQFPTEIPLAIEVRHESWFNNAANTERLFELLSQHQTATVLTDVAGRRDVLHMSLTTGTAMVRFVGNGLHPSDYTRLDEWRQRLVQWFEQGLTEAYFFTHEPDNIQAPEIAAYFTQQLQQNARIQTRGPKLNENSGQQISLF